MRHSGADTTVTGRQDTKIVHLGAHRRQQALRVLVENTRKAGAGMAPAPDRDGDGGVRAAATTTGGQVVAFDRRSRATERLARAMASINAAGVELAMARGNLADQSRRLDDQRHQLSTHSDRLTGIVDDLNQRAARLRQIEAAAGEVMARAEALHGSEIEHQPR